MILITINLSIMSILMKTVTNRMVSHEQSQYMWVSIHNRYIEAYFGFCSFFETHMDFTSHLSESNTYFQSIRINRALFTTSIKCAVKQNWILFISVATPVLIHPPTTSKHIQCSITFDWWSIRVNLVE